MERLPEDAHRVAEEIFSLRRGVITDKLTTVLRKLRKMGIRAITVDSRVLASAIREAGGVQVKIDDRAARVLRKDLVELAKVFGVD
ncbi:MAG: hypothetical protein DRN99_06150, partial [Thermoproteota archaeon]